MTRRRKVNRSARSFLHDEHEQEELRGDEMRGDFYPDRRDDRERPPKKTKPGEWLPSRKGKT